MKTEATRLRELLAINRTISSTDDYDAVLGLIAQTARAFADARAALVLLAAPGEPATVAASDGVALEAARAFRGALDERIGASLRAWFGLGPAPTVLAVPMILRGDVRGILAVVRDREPGVEATEREEEYLLSALADQAAIALGHAAHLKELEGALAAADRLTAEIRRSESHLRSLIELAPDAFFLADMDARIVDVNQAACRLLGYERGELVGKTLFDIIPPEDAPRLEAVKAELLTPGRVIKREWTDVRKEGSRVPVEVSSNILADGRWQGFARDISDRRKAEREQRLLADAGAVLASSLDIEQTLAEVGRLGVREYADWCFVELLGPDNEFKRVKVVSADPRNAPLAARYETLRLDRSRPYLVRPVIETARPFLLERVTPTDLAAFAQDAEHLRMLEALDARSVMGLPLVAHGELLGALVFVSSTPGRTYGPDDLPFAMALADRAALAIENGRLYQAALQATRLREQVLGVVAHDLRNPLAAIVMQTALLRRRDGGPERRDQKTVESIRRAADRMDRLIQDLLEVSVVEARQLGVAPARVAVRELLTDFVNAQRPLASAASLALRLELAGALPDVRGDPHRLLQVLENLVGNAMKFTPAGGRVTVGAAARERDVEFWVADTGCGIAPEACARVFAPFWQATKQARQGAGLGLAITRGIVEAHGGRIRVESEPSRGSTFYFTIPQWRAEEDARAPASTRHARS